MGKRSSPQSSNVNFYDSYLSWVENTDQSGLFKRWGIFLVGSIALIIASSIMPVGGDYVKALIALPAAAFLFAIFLGVSHWRHVETGTPTLKMKYSARRRRKIALVSVIVTLIFILSLSQYIPYALGGTILLTVLFILYDLIRVTPEEVVLDEAGIPDPRDYMTQKELDTLADEEESDIVDEDFSWDSDENDDFDLDEETK
jgi:Na+/proline symporter